jgi:hypothetical protein
MELSFLNGEEVVVIATGVKGTVHHAERFTDQEWRYVVAFPGGSQKGYTAAELRYPTDDDA